MNRIANALRTAADFGGALLAILALAPFLAAACASERRDLALKAADAGKTPDEYERDAIALGL